MRPAASAVTGLFASLVLFLGLSAGVLAESTKPSPELERIEVASIQIQHPNLKRAARVLVAPGSMATVEIDGRAIGLRVTALHAYSASIEVLELERISAIGPGATPKYEPVRILAQTLIEPGRAKSLPATSLELSFTREELVRKSGSADCGSTSAAAKGGNEECCVSCGETSTFCGLCVTAHCGMCCSP